MRSTRKLVLSVSLWCLFGGGVASVSAQTPSLPPPEGRRATLGAPLEAMPPPESEPAPAPGGKVVPEPVQAQDIRGAVPPAANQGEGGGGGTCDCQPWWKRVPVVQPTPRTGWFLIPPTGPGYYSFQNW